MKKITPIPEPSEDARIGDIMLLLILKVNQLIEANNERQKK